MITAIRLNALENRYNNRQFFIPADRTQTPPSYDIAPPTFCMTLLPPSDSLPDQTVSQPRSSHQASALQWKLHIMHNEVDDWPSSANCDQYLSICIFSSLKRKLVNKIGLSCCAMRFVTRNSKTCLGCWYYVMEFVGHVQHWRHKWMLSTPGSEITDTRPRWRHHSKNSWREDIEDNRIMQLQDNITAIGVATCRDSPSHKIPCICVWVL